MVRAEGNGSKAEHDRLRRTMLEQGYTTEQIATEMMTRWGYRPRQAWRHTHGWTQQQVADRYNQLVQDPLESMTSQRISDYENWPPGGKKPSITTLHALARLYGTHPANLVDLDERDLLDGREKLALTSPTKAWSRDWLEESNANDTTNNNAVPQQIPTPLPHFIGRKHELEFLDKIADSGDRPRAIVICGPAGVGKTALAIEWANHNCGKFPDGQLHVDLHGFDDARPVSREEVFDSFLRALGAPPDELPGLPSAQESMYRSMMAGKRVLVVLDNAESAESVRPFLVGSNTMLVVTSRKRLAGLEAREGIPCLAVNIFSPNESFTLLVRLIGQERLKDARDSVYELARLCDNLPLALCVAARQIVLARHLTLSTHIQSLAAEGRMLDELSFGDDERTTIKAVFSWSYRKLPRMAAAFFQALSVSPGRDISLTAAAALCDVDITAARNVLRTLVGMHLIEEQSSQRYTFYGLLRAYAEDLAENEDHMNNQTANIRRLVRWYVASADNADRFLTPGGVERDDIVHVPSEGEQFSSYDDALRWFDQERANLIDITRRATEIGEHKAASVIPNLLWGYFNLTKHWDDWITCNTLGLTSARASGDNKSEAYILMSQGVVYSNLRQYSEAISNLQPAIALFEQIDDRLGLAYALQNLANAQSPSGHIEEAMVNFRRALDIFETLPDSTRGKAVTLNSMAFTYNAAHEHEQALTAAQEAAEMMRSIDDLQGVAIALSNIGNALTELSRPDEAIESYQASLTIRRGRINDRYGEARTLYRMGKIDANNGRTQEARARWTEALAILSNISAPESAEVEEALGRLQDNI